MKRLYELFIKLDCTQVEVNPLAETPDGKGMLINMTLKTRS